MKKFITVLLSVAMIAALSFSSVSCKKESKNPLVGTTWVSLPYVDGDYGEIYTLNFTTESLCNFSVVWEEYGEMETDSVMATYTYVEPTVTVMAGAETMTGTVNGNVMIMYNGEGVSLQFNRR